MPNLDLDYCVLVSVEKKISFVSTTVRDRTSNTLSGAPESVLSGKIVTAVTRSAARGARAHAQPRSTCMLRYHNIAEAH